MAIVTPEKSAAHDNLPTVRETNEVGAILTSDEYFKVLRKKNTRPAFWKWKDVKAKLDQLAADPLREAERRFCTTINSDTEELAGAAPFVFIGWQILHPGEEVPNHRHNSYAIYHILQGRGYTIVENVKYEWEKGDTLSCPAWAYHAHYPQGDEDTIMYVVQDMPMLAASRTLMWEEPQGQENIRHAVQGASKSWSTTRTDVD